MAANAVHECSEKERFAIVEGDVKAIKERLKDGREEFNTISGDIKKIIRDLGYIQGKVAAWGAGAGVTAALIFELIKFAKEALIKGGW
jgi:hypothetical protein